MRPLSGPAAVLRSMAATRAPWADALRPPGCIEGMVFDAIAGLPNPPTVQQIAHWSELRTAQVRTALDRLLVRGLVVPAGLMHVRRVVVQSYRVAGPAGAAAA